MHTAALTTTSETWVTIQHVGTLIAACAGVFAAVYGRFNRSKINQIHINTNGRVTRLEDKVEEQGKQITELTAERDAARAEAEAVKTVLPALEAPK